MRTMGNINIKNSNKISVIDGNNNVQTIGTSTGVNKRLDRQSRNNREGA